MLLNDFVEVLLSKRDIWNVAVSTFRMTVDGVFQQGAMSLGTPHDMTQNGNQKFMVCSQKVCCKSVVLRSRAGLGTQYCLAIFSLLKM